jgi:two-component system nitrogen regulation sensor histidine kinase NtrY
MRDGRAEHHDQVTIIRSGRERTINIRVTTERATGQAHGYVVTLDDITDLVTAQRSSAWADIARRIAHEIKNPLTPIQLSAERLKRKFGRSISEDKDVFDQCTDTIIRQVGDIGRMVDEFSSFARMPKPTMQTGNLSDVVREAVFLVSVSQPEIGFDTKVPSEALVGRFDSRLLGQALGNLIKNATEAILAVPPSADFKGQVEVVARTEGASIVVDVIDNGIGLPRENRHRLLEPYVTTREKGTGLGLAIVTKIIEEHGGRVELLDAPAVAHGGHGAMIRITLPRADVVQVEETQVKSAASA